MTWFKNQINQLILPNQLIKMLYILATPIGNLKDITLRALETLKSVDFIIAENPSHTATLLNHYEIKKPLVQFADHNETTALPKILERLKTETASLVSDAGTPGISDPGFRLVRACREKNIPVTPIPGPSAAITALCASGLPTDKFLFIGFFQKTENKVLKAINEARDTESTLIAYESPQRIIKTLTTINKYRPDCKVVVARELTKLHEEFLTGTPSEVITTLKSKPSIKGEITLLISFK